MVQFNESERILDCPDVRGCLRQNSLPPARTDRLPHPVLPNRTDRSTVVLAKNGVSQACESFADGTGLISTFVTDVERLFPGWDVVGNGPPRTPSSASSTAHDEHLEFARALIFRVVSAYWEERLAATGHRWPLREFPSDIDLAAVPRENRDFVQSIGKSAAQLNVADASYLIGVLYTTAIPAKARAKLGAYYTPLALCERLLDMAAEAGVDWRSVRVLDPACGGGAFLSPVVRRMVESLKDCRPPDALESIRNRLQGFEIDPFAAWMSQVFLDVTLTDAQAARHLDAERDAWLPESMRPAAGNIEGRWYAANTREPIRDETLREGLVRLGAVTEREGLPTTSPLPRYALAADFAALFGPGMLVEAPQARIAQWQEANLSPGALARIAIIRRGAVAREGRVLVTFPNGETRDMEPGPSSVISKAVVEEFAGRFLEQPGVIWLSESRNQVVARDDRLAQAIGLVIDPGAICPISSWSISGPPSRCSSSSRSSRRTVRSTKHVRAR